MKRIAIIPARGGSKRVPHKNIKMCGGAPLISWSISAALRAGVFDNVFVSTDDADISKISLSYGAEVPFLRPFELSSDAAQMLPVLLHLINELAFKDDTQIVLLQPTSPLRHSHHIRKACEIMGANQLNGVVSVCEIAHIYHPDKLMRLNDGFLEPVTNLKESQFSRHTLETFYHRNGPAILVTNAHNIRKNILYPANMFPYIMEQESSIDIDTSTDFKIADLLIRSLVQEGVFSLPQKT